MACAGDPTEICGDSNRMNVYQNGDFNDYPSTVVMYDFAKSLFAELLVVQNAAIAWNDTFTASVSSKRSGNLEERDDSDLIPLMEFTRDSAGALS